MALAIAGSGLALVEITTRSTERLLARQQIARQRAVGVRHDPVGHHHAGMHALREGKGAEPDGRPFHGIAFLLKRAGPGVRYARFVVNYENGMYATLHGIRL